MTAELFLGFEIHDVSLWEPHRVLPMVDRMEAWGYNALVLHQNDLLDACTQLGLTANYGVSDLRLKKVRNNVAWLNRLVDRLNLFGARLFLEIKEPSFHDYAVELFPDLLDEEGRPDPTRPQWPAFCAAKTRDLLERVPGLGGLIVNISSPESRVSMPDHLATSGNEEDVGRWLGTMIDAFHQPLSKSGKDLFIRDFSYTADLQSDVLTAVSRTAGSVGACVKITAHDYFPEFPENPALGFSPDPVLVEVEAFGEHTGWGVIPNCRVAEYRERLAKTRKIGVAGYLQRTSWEAVSGANALDCLSAVNVFAIPRLAVRDHEPISVVQDWLADSHDLRGEVANQVAALLIQSWQIPAAAYWDGKVFPRHSCLPSTWREGWLSMETSGMGRRDRELFIQQDDFRLSDEAGMKLFEEKEKATALAEDLWSQAKDLLPRLSGELAEQFKTFRWLPFFARQFELATKATFYAARNLPSDQSGLRESRDDLLELARELDQYFSQSTDISAQTRVLLDPNQIRLFTQSLLIRSE